MIYWYKFVYLKKLNIYSVSKYNKQNGIIYGIIRGRDQVYILRTIIHISTHFLHPSISHFLSYLFE